MQQLEIVSGFSELKDLLIRTYKISRNRELVKLYFSTKENALLMHDFDDHKKELSLCSNLKEGSIRKTLAPRAYRLVAESLNHVSPTDFLNCEFQLNGFFIS